jgi:hypothetical protein
MVSMFPIGPKVCRSNPAEAIDLKGNIIPQHAFFRKVSNAFGMKKNTSKY